MIQLFLAFGFIAGAFTLVAIVATVRTVSRARRLPDPECWPAIAVLRPCEGDEPDLVQRLRSTLRTDYPGALVQFVGHGGALSHVYSDLENTTWIASAPAPAGCNRKAWHLHHAFAAVPPTDALILAIDADVEVTGELLRALVRGVLAPGTVATYGAPLQSGDARSARWGRAALGGSAHAFVTLAALSELTGSAPAMVGCAIAVRREALEAAGGFTRALGVIGDDLALGEALYSHGRVALAPAVVDCRDATQTTAGLRAQLTRWVRVAGAHRPRVLATYPLLIAPLPILALISLPVILERPAISLAVLASVYALRVALALVLRRTVYGHRREAFLDPWLADALWSLAWLGALRLRTVQWRAGNYRVGRGGRLEVSP